MKKLPKIEEFTVVNGSVDWNQIKELFGIREYKKFGRWMYGQTVGADGVYVCDLERYLYQRSRGTKEPSIVD